MAISFDGGESERGSAGSGSVTNILYALLVGAHWRKRGVVYHVHRSNYPPDIIPIADHMDTLTRLTRINCLNVAQRAVWRVTNSANSLDHYLIAIAAFIWFDASEASITPQNIAHLPITIEHT